MSRSQIFISLATIVLASSCDKPDILKSERAKVEAQIKQTSEKMLAVDTKFDTLRSTPLPDGLTLENHLDAVVKKNVQLGSELADLGKKCAEAEAALSEYRPRLQTYKAKYLY